RPGSDLPVSRLNLQPASSFMKQPRRIDSHFDDRFIDPAFYIDPSRNNFFFFTKINPSTSIPTSPTQMLSISLMSDPFDVIPTSPMMLLSIL
ncbi:hypothetical protein PGTUg99_012468, partial [Puccinia graminis f. sp. tritici]